MRWQTGLGLNKVNQIRRNQQRVKVQLRRIKSKLNENLVSLIDMSDYANKTVALLDNIKAKKTLFLAEVLLA